MDTLAIIPKLYIDHEPVLVNELGLANVRLIKLDILFKALQSGMFDIPVPIVIYFELKPRKQSILVNEFGIVKFVNGQPANALSPMLVTESGISILISPVQPENALTPILVHELGLAKLTFTNKELLANALSPILVTELGITYEILLLGQNTNVENVLSNRTPSATAYNVFEALTIIVEIALPCSAPISILATESGIVILIKEVHAVNTPEPMLVTESGIVILDKEEHP